MNTKNSLNLISKEVIDNYNPMDQQINGFLYVRMEKGMYGLFWEGISSHTRRSRNIYSHLYMSLRQSRRYCGDTTRM